MTTDYGVDISCTDDADERWSLASELETVYQWCYRAITTRRGLIPSAPDRFLDIGEELQGVVDDMKLALLSSTIADELEQDKRITSATVRIERLATDGTEAGYTVSISVKCGLGPFDIVVDVSEAGAVRLRGD